MGSVEIAVTDGGQALRFYREYVGLTPLPSQGSELRLGAAGREVVVLHPGAERPVVPHTSGLYHLAIVVPDRRDPAVTRSTSKSCSLTCALTTASRSRCRRARRWATSTSTSQTSTTRSGSITTSSALTSWATCRAWGSSRRADITTTSA